MLPKTKQIKLKGRALAALNAEVHSRDKGCILCGAWVDPGEKFHHYPQGADKQDRIEGGVVLCRTCHDAAHFGEFIKMIKRQIEDYLRGLYPEYWGG